MITTTKRERGLAIMAGVLLLIVVAMMASIGMGNLFGDHSSKKTALVNEVAALTRIANKKMLAEQRFLDYQQRSLPTDPNVSRHEYRAWLIRKLEEHFEGDITLKVSADGSHLGVYRILSFTVTGVGNIDQLSRFLHDFYSVKTLHRIQSMTVAPKEDSKELKLTFLIEALSVIARPGDKTAERAELNVAPDMDRLRFEKKTAEDYVDAIVDRNLFGPPNQAPEINSIRTQRITTRDSLKLKVAATDKDELDKLTFVLGAGGPEGAKLQRVDDRTAELSWSPRDVGQNKFALRVYDDGFPKREQTAEFDVYVDEYKAPPVTDVVQPPTTPRFDDAKYTILTAVLQKSDGTRVVWLDPKTKSQESPDVIGLNKEFKYGSVTGKIREIGAEHMVFESQGKRYTMKIGQSLADAVD